MTYTYHLADPILDLEEILHLYKRHYGEMKARLAEAGIEIGAFNPRVDAYAGAFQAGRLLHYVVRADGKAVGYSNVYITSDMHNGELIAREDTIYVHPNHRKGCGRKLMKEILLDLQRRGVKRFIGTASTDPRATKLWERMGFRPAGLTMMYVFEGSPHVRA